MCGQCACVCVCVCVFVRVPACVGGGVYGINGIKI